MTVDVTVDRGSLFHCYVADLYSSFFQRVCTVYRHSEVRAFIVVPQIVAKWREKLSSTGNELAPRLHNNHFYT